ncbi:hypothetical protein [Yoonia sp. 208BN28-4]|uniref:hypothetical protein n=1 Tax=Yoonia sp. 208BN28-4 TaxID=3126505 RepID=UPI0030986766
MNTALAAWRACFVRRWHQNPEMSAEDDLICAHQGRCAVLVMALFPDHSAALLRAAIVHDLGESAVGDIAAPSKDRKPVWLMAHAQAEVAALADLGFRVDLDDLDAARLKLVDRLDAYLFAALRRPHLTARDGWRADRKRIEELAFDLNVATPVFMMLRGVAT